MIIDRIAAVGADTSHIESDRWIRVENLTLRP